MMTDAHLSRIEGGTAGEQPDTCPPSRLSSALPLRNTGYRTTRPPDLNGATAMRRFLVCGGVHGQIESLEWLRKAVRQHRPDGVLFAGGVLDRERTYAPTSTTCWGHTKSDTL